MGESTRSDETEWFILQTLHTYHTNTSSGIVQNSTGYIY